MAKKNGLWNEFKAFAIKGNAMNLAVGVIIGGAFSTITTSIYGFSDQAITASIEPMGMVISTASSALIQ